MSTVFTVP